MQRIAGSASESFRYVGGSPNKIYALESADFLDSTNQYKAQVNRMLDSQKLMDYFERTQRLKADYQMRYLESLYETNYGIDPSKRWHWRRRWLSENLAKATPTDFRQSSLQTKPPERSFNQRPHDALENGIWENFDLNNEDLFIIAAFRKSSSH